MARRTTPPVASALLTTRYSLLPPLLPRRRLRPTHYSLPATHYFLSAPLPMWLFTQHGFYSLTRSSDEPNKLQVRARVRRDLENLQAHSGITGPILETPTADYRWRWIVTPAEAKVITLRLTQDITYSNFKSTVAQQPDQFAKLSGLHDIWEIHHDWQNRGA